MSRRRAFSVVGAEGLEQPHKTRGKLPTTEKLTQYPTHDLRELRLIQAFHELSAEDQQKLMAQINNSLTESSE